jgi:hypothetical protein
MSRLNEIKRVFGWPQAEERSATLSNYIEWLNQAGQGMAVWGAPAMTLGQKQEEIDPTFDSFALRLFKSNPIVFACCERRRSLFSEAPLTWRDRQKGKLFGTQALRLFEEPWPNGSTGDLLSRMMQDADLAGNWFGVRKEGQILRLKPDWTVIVLGGEGYGDPKAVPVGYVYFPGGKGAGTKPITFGANEVAHFAPIEDPLFTYRGMSWMQPIIKEARADQASTDYKLGYLEDGAVPNRVVKPDPRLSPEEFQAFKEIFLEKHAGVGKQFSTIFLGGGSDIEVIGSNLKEVDFKAVQAGGENRIAVAAGVPAIIAGVTEGLEAATYANFPAAKRQFAEGTMRNLWRSAFAALETLVHKDEMPGGAELWYDEGAVPYLQEDEKDRAEVLKEKASAAKMLFEAGFEPDSITQAIVANDISLLEHSGLPSVQLQTYKGVLPDNPTPEKNSPEKPTNGKGDPEAVPQPKTPSPPA